MAKQNQLFETMGFIDDDIAANAIKTAEQSKHKRPLRIAMIAAVSLAAGLAIAVGIRNWGGIMGNYIFPADAPVNQSGVSYEAPDFGESEASSPDDSVNDQNGETIWFNAYAQNFVIPESFKPDETEISHYFYDLEMLPTELFAEFGISPLMNDNFTDIIETGEEQHDNHRPSVWVNQAGLDFSYCLYDKNINKYVIFNTSYHVDNGNTCGKSSGNDVIYMKDGSVGLISQNDALFAYNGVMYFVTVLTSADDGNSYIKDVLSDLGVL